jgi:hypothetical protein
MTTDEKLAAILAAVQIDPGNRGLARDPHDNLLTATAKDFQAACRSFVNHPQAALGVTTGFFIPAASPPAFETDGPLGAAFVLRALAPLGYQVSIGSGRPVTNAIASALATVAGLMLENIELKGAMPETDTEYTVQPYGTWPKYPPTHYLIIEHVGRATDGRYYSMRGHDITEFTKPIDRDLLPAFKKQGVLTIGIGDGGNEIGMGKISHETIIKNIPNGDLIHCRVPTDYLIVAGVSNWGAYAFAAGVYVLRGVKPPPRLFDPDHEREILKAMVRVGPLVDGVTGQQTATVDGLSWEEYAKPLVRIREILES